MSQYQAVSLSETNSAQAPLDFNTETLQDLDVRSDEVKGGVGVAAKPAPTVQNPSGGRMTVSVVPSGTSVIIGS